MKNAITTKKKIFRHFRSKINYFAKKLKMQHRK